MDRKEEGKRKWKVDLEMKMTLLTQDSLLF
jgi:hypothetical protein